MFEEIAKELQKLGFNKKEIKAMLSVESKPIDDGRLDAIYSYINELELCLTDAGIALPSSREDVDWELFKKSSA